MNELSDKDKEILKLMFSLTWRLLDLTEDVVLKSIDWFDTNDLYRLAEKLGIDYET